MQPWGPALADTKGIGDTHFSFSFPGLQSHQPLPSGAPIHSADEYPHKTPLPTTSSWLLDAHTLSLAHHQGNSPLAQTCPSGLPPETGQCLSAPTPPQSKLNPPTPALLETSSQLWKDLPFPLSPPTASGGCFPNRCQPSKV